MGTFCKHRGFTCSLIPAVCKILPINILAPPFPLGVSFSLHCRGNRPSLLSPPYSHLLLPSLLSLLTISSAASAPVLPLPDTLSVHLFFSAHPLPPKTPAGLVVAIWHLCINLRDSRPCCPPLSLSLSPGANMVGPHYMYCGFLPYSLRPSLLPLPVRLYSHI